MIAVSTFDTIGGLAILAICAVSALIVYRK